MKDWLRRWWCYWVHVADWKQESTVAYWCPICKTHRPL